MTPTGSLNYEATNKFIDHLSGNIKERIKLVLCLDSLTDSSTNTSTLHIIPGSLAESDSTANQFIKEFKKAAGKKQVKVDVKDSSFSSPNRRFIQHEHVIYNDKGIPSLTITAKDQKYTNRYQKYSVFDNTLRNDDLRRNILIISEALVKLVYAFHEKNINFFIDNDAIVSESFLEQIKTFLSKNPRAPLMIQRDSPISKEFHKLLGQNVNSIKRMGVSIKDTQFYEEKLDNKIQTYLVTSKLMELYVFFGILTYLILLYLVLQKMSSHTNEKIESTININKQIE